MTCHESVSSRRPHHRRNEKRPATNDTDSDISHPGEDPSRLSIRPKTGCNVGRNLLLKILRTINRKSGIFLALTVEWIELFLGDQSCVWEAKALSRPGVLLNFHNSQELFSSLFIIVHRRWLLLSTGPFRLLAHPIAALPLTRRIRNSFAPRNAHFLTISFFLYSPLDSAGSAGEKCFRLPSSLIPPTPTPVPKCFKLINIRWRNRRWNYGNIFSTVNNCKYSGWLSTQLNHMIYDKLLIFICRNKMKWKFILLHWIFFPSAPHFICQSVCQFARAHSTQFSALSGRGKAVTTPFIIKTGTIHLFQEFAEGLSLPVSDIWNWDLSRQDN